MPPLSNIFYEINARRIGYNPYSRVGDDTPVAEEPSKSSDAVVDVIKPTAVVDEHDDDSVTAETASVASTVSNVSEVEVEVEEDKNSTTETESTATTTTSSAASEESPLPTTKPIIIKAVAFDNDVTIHETIHKDEYTRVEQAATWWSREEFYVIKASRKLTLKLMDQPAAMDFMKHQRSSSQRNNNSDDICFRGLESKTKAGSRRKRYNAMDGVTSVLDEQLSQDQRGIIDPEQISTVYQLRTRHCVEQALKLAKQDEIDANTCWL